MVTGRTLAASQETFWLSFCRTLDPKATFGRKFGRRTTKTKSRPDKKIMQPKPRGHSAWCNTSLPLSMSLIKPALLSCAVFGSLALLLEYRRRKRRPRSNENDQSTAAAYDALVGHTPLVKLQRLSHLLQRDIYVKMESMNPGGTGKDRAALGMIRAAERERRLPQPNNSQTATRPTMENKLSSGPTTLGALQKGEKVNDVLLDAYIQKAMIHSTSGGLVVEGTSGSTGIALAQLCRSRGHACLVTLPDDQAVEKQRLLRALGASVIVVPTASISHPQHYVNLARRLAERARQAHGIAAVFMNQFENPANVYTHYTETGPEIWKDCDRIDAFCMSAGTGGTLAGVGRFLKETTAGHCHVVLVDPPGSVLYHKIQHGVAFTPQQAERSLRRHRYDTIAEGIGLDRLTHNISCGLDYIDEAIRVTDQEALDMAHWLLQREGLWVGSSSSMNVVGAIRTALTLPPGSCVVTVICDAGSRHVTRFWNRDFCEKWGLNWPQEEGKDESRVPECLQPVYDALAVA